MVPSALRPTPEVQPRPVKSHVLPHLRALEAESIFIFREVAAEMPRPCLLFSGGKDSTVMLAIARKAFAPARIPFPIMHVDTGLNFQEVLDYRDRGSPSRAPADRRVGARRPSSAGWSTRSPTARATGSRRRSCSRRSSRTASTPCSAARGATRRRLGPRSACSRSATSSGSGTPRTSARALEPLQRQGPAGPVDPGVPALELDRARHLDLHRRRRCRDRAAVLRIEREVVERGDMLYVVNEFTPLPATARPTGV